MPDTREDLRLAKLQLTGREGFGDFTMSIFIRTDVSLEEAVDIVLSQCKKQVRAVTFLSWRDEEALPSSAQRAE